MSSATEGQNKKLRMKAFLIHSPASAAFSAGSRAALSSVVPLGASQGHCAVHIVGARNIRDEIKPQKSLLTCSSCLWHSWFFCCTPSHFFHRSYSSGKMLHLLWFSIDGSVKKSLRQLRETRDLWTWEGSERTNCCTLWKLKGDNLRFRGLGLARESDYVHLWEEEPKLWWKILKKKIEICSATLIRSLIFSGLYWL